MLLTLTPARPDDAMSVIPLLIDAMGEITTILTGEEDEALQSQALLPLWQGETTRLSYKNGIVIRDGERPIAIALVYDGSLGKTMDETLMAMLRQDGRFLAPIESECEPCELYIDSLCVDPDYRGHGIASQLLGSLDRVARSLGLKRLSLIMACDKPHLAPYYEKQGFIFDKTLTLYGHDYQRRIKTLPPTKELP